MNLLATNDTEPTPDERRHAVCMAMAWAPGLIRFAARFTHSLEDAEDAYQRGMEIALTRAPVTDPDAFVTWLHTVIRREASEIALVRSREAPTPHTDLDQAITARFEQPAGPHAVAEWRERYRGLQDAWSGLSDAQRVCLMLRSTGVSRPEIQVMTGFSERQVHRSIAEGYARLTEWEIRMTTGEACGHVAEMMEGVIDGSASRRDRRVLSRHIGHCAACRSRYRGQRDQVRLLGSLVPTVLIGAQTLQAGPPDPSLALTWWDRVSASATVKSAQAVQMMMDIPALATSKAGAGAIAAAAAGVVGTPMVMDAVNTHRTGPPVEPRVASVSAVASPVSPSAPPAAAITPLPARPSSAIPSKATVKAAIRPLPKARVTVKTTTALTTDRQTQDRSGRPMQRSSPAAEFGP